MALVPVLTQKQKRLFNLGAVAGIAAASASRPGRLLAQRGARGILARAQRGSIFSLTKTRTKLRAVEDGVTISRARFQEASIARGLVRNFLKRIARTPAFKARELAVKRKVFATQRKRASSLAEEAFRRGQKAAATRAKTAARKK